MQQQQYPPAAIDRRRALAVLGGAGLAAVTLAACSSDGSATPGTSGTTTSDTATTDTATTDTATTDTATNSTATNGTATTDVVEIPEETGGPFPADGTNGVNVLTEDGVVRRDLTSSFAGATGVASGVPMTVTLILRDVAEGGDPLAGAAVYLWHCDADGRYSLYSDGAADRNYLRGVQVSDEAGQVTFDTIVPGCYDGRWPHMHFEIYEDLDSASNGRNAIATSQLALPKGVAEAAYLDPAYPSSADNLARVSLSSDNVFGDDGAAHQLAVVTGDVGSGFVATLPVGV
jgi:protocatechuate 3,4-dioxygenase beta subunit